jgi:phosphoribosylanthranilate isomerase
MEKDVTQIETPVVDGPNSPAAGLPAGPVVKICGLTRAEDVRLVAESGAWALGFVFAPSSRRVTVDQATELVAEARRVPPESATYPLMVGVFGDAPADEIARTVVAAGLDAVQLHGRSGPGAGEVRRALEGLVSASDVVSRPSPAPGKVLMIQAVAVDPNDDDPEELRRRIVAAKREADLVLLDTGTRGRFGGTGMAFPWDLARAANDGGRFLIAGGIDPGNAGEAVRRSGAWGVDVSSGVETSPGVKDAQSVKKLIEVVNDIRSRETGTVDARLEGSTK